MEGMGGGPLKKTVQSRRGAGSWPLPEEARNSTAPVTQCGLQNRMIQRKRASPASGQACVQRWSPVGEIYVAGQW